MRVATFFICYLYFLPSANAQLQPDWGLITAGIYESLERETADSIAARRAESAILRAEMEKIVSAKGLSRAMIFGPADEYLIEGMSKNFKSEPKSMQVTIDRDAAIIRLENLHVDLYNSDKTLLRWLDIQNRLKAYKQRMDRYSWELRYNNLPAERKKALNNDQLRVQWGAHEMVCMLVTDLGGFSSQNPRGKVEMPKLEFDLLHDSTTYESGKNWTLPLPADKILVSMPMNGQYAFCPAESIPGSGYMAFPKGAIQLLREITDKNQILKARWTSAGGELLYTDAAPENGFNHNIIYYSLPQNYFQTDKVYQLELVAVPENAHTQVDANDACWQKFRGGPSKSNVKPLRNTGETKIAEIYFRTGHYAVMQRPETMKGDINWDTGTITFSTDEPLDQTELLPGAHYTPVVQFGFTTAGMYSFEQKLLDKALFYYFTVPQVEDLDQLPPGQLAVIERDNTLDAPFVRQVSLAKPEQYISVPDTRDGPMPLAGGYVTPAFSRAFAPDSMTTDKPVPFITRAHFERSPPVLGQVKCTLVIGELRQTLAAITLQQEQIRRRMEERAAFFYALEKRRAARTGAKPAGDLDYFRQMEKTNLPESAKMLLNTDAVTSLQQGFTVLYTRKYPGTKQRSAELTIKY